MCRRLLDDYSIPPHQYTTQNKNSHTTSTKCQYHAAASNPKWCCRVKCPLINRRRQTNKKIVPTCTWSPWKPVARKKVEPYTESEIWNGLSIYSSAWNPVKKNARITVKARLIIASFRYPATIEWWAQVTAQPDRSRSIVLRSGTSQGLKAIIPCGGQTLPIWIAGTIDEWKKAQKKAKKNITSDTINKTIPIRCDFCTAVVWRPSNVASRTTSRHHVNITNHSITWP